MHICTEMWDVACYETFDIAQDGMKIHAVFKSESDHFQFYLHDLIWSEWFWMVNFDLQTTSDSPVNASKIMVWSCRVVSDCLFSCILLNAAGPKLSGYSLHDVVTITSNRHSINSIKSDSC